MGGAGIDADVHQFAFRNIGRPSDLILANGKVSTQKILRDKPDHLIEIARSRFIQQEILAGLQADLAFLNNFSSRDIRYRDDSSPVRKNANPRPYRKISFGIAYESAPQRFRLRSRGQL